MAKWKCQSLLAEGGRAGAWGVPWPGCGDMHLPEAGVLCRRESGWWPRQADPAGRGLGPASWWWLELGLRTLIGGCARWPSVQQGVQLESEGLDLLAVGSRKDIGRDCQPSTWKQGTAPDGFVG